MKLYNLESLDGEPLRIFETTQEELGSGVERGENEAVGNKREINVGKEVEITSIAGDRDIA